MLRDETHIFRSMWASRPFMKRAKGRPNCWDIRRDSTWARQPSSAYFEETLRGAHCNTNWYTGNEGELGQVGRFPQFTSNVAPALLGFDETIDSFCNSANKPSNRYWGHAGMCINANLNILSLYGDAVPYNICRNLEWQVCAAKGLLPGQNSPVMVFARAPKTLDPDPSGGKPLGMCGGWRPPELGWGCRDGCELCTLARTLQ